MLNALPAWLRAPSLSTQIMVALVVGVGLGAWLPDIALALEPLATIFLRLIKMLIAPLVFATLVVGIAGSGSGHTVGRLGFRTLVYFEISTVIALVIGLVVANVLQPGAGLELTAVDTSVLESLGSLEGGNHGGGFWGTLVHMVPTSVIDAMARGDVLQIVVFAVFFALALMAAGDAGKPIMRGMEALSAIMFKLVGLVMVFAPLGVLGAISAAVGRNGLDVLLGYAKLIGSLYLALILFAGVLLLIMAWYVRVPALRFLKAVQEPFILAFSTATSEAALPKAMEAMERFGVPKHVVSFVIPTGYSFNLDGSALYLTLATLFVAQIAGIQLDLGQQLLILLTLLITSKGVAAVPRASLVILASTLAAFGLPLEGAALILGVDHLMDMARTSVNLLGNCLASVIVAKWEGVFNPQAACEGSAQQAQPDTQANEATKASASSSSLNLMLS